MSDASSQMKEQLVKQYIDKVDFTNFTTSDLTVSDITEGLKTILKQTPTIEIKYKKDILITEDGGVKKRKVVDEKVQSVIVAFIDGEYRDNQGRVIPKVHKFTYVIG